MAGFKMIDIKLIVLALLSVLFICLLLKQLGVLNKKQENSLERFNNYPIERFQTSTSNSPECNVSFDESTGTLTLTGCSNQRISGVVVNYRNNNNVKKVILPENLTKIDKGAFKNFQELREVVINSDSKFECESYAFQNCKKLHIFPWNNLIINNNQYDYIFEKNGFIHINHINDYNLNRYLVSNCLQLRQIVISGNFVDEYFKKKLNSYQNNNLNTLVCKTSNINNLLFNINKSDNIINNSDYLKTNFLHGNFIKIPSPFEIVNGNLQRLKCNIINEHINLPNICTNNIEKIINIGNCRKDYELVPNNIFHNHLIPENFILETHDYNYTKMIPKYQSTTTGSEVDQYTFESISNEKNATIFSKEETSDGSIYLKAYDEKLKLFRYMSIDFDIYTIEFKSRNNVDTSDKVKFIYIKGNTVLILNSETTVPTEINKDRGLTLYGIYPPLKFKLKTYQHNKYISFNHEQTTTISGNIPQFYNRVLDDNSDNADIFNLVRNRNGTICLQRDIDNKFLTINNIQNGGGITFTDNTFDGSNKEQLSEFTIRFLPDYQNNSKIAFEINFTTTSDLKINRFFRINSNTDEEQNNNFMTPSNSIEDNSIFILEPI